jgi:hypothetical protein
MTDLFYKLPQALAARRDLTGNDKMVFVVLLNYYSQNGKAYPGIRTIAEATGLTPVTVNGCVHDLEKLGLLVIDRRGCGKRNFYHITETVKESNTVSGIGKPCKSLTHTVKESNTEPCKSLTRIRKDILKDKGGGISFKTFWEAYPRKQAKADAEAAFRTLNPDPELYAAMLAALERQKQSDQWRRSGGQYIPYPATWLEKRRWEDNLSDPQARTESDRAADRECERTAAMLERYRQEAR